ncbi:MAG: hypothetical protein ABW020_11855 [Candidatus Rokuibacteriota bacterium]
MATIEEPGTQPPGVGPHAAGEDQPEERYLQPLLLVVRRDQAELLRMLGPFNVTAGFGAIVDRRHGDRRSRTEGRAPLQRRRRERRRRTWVSAVLAAEGAVVVRV